MTMENVVTNGEALLPPGTPVWVRQKIQLGGRTRTTEIVGVVEAWEDSATGASFAHGKGGKLHLGRLRLRKADGEQVLLNIDPDTEIARIEASGGSAL